MFQTHPAAGRHQSTVGRSRERTPRCGRRRTTKGSGHPRLLTVPPPADIKSTGARRTGALILAVHRTDPRMKSILTPRADARAFRRCLWGYDRAQVDQFLHRTAADRQRLQEDLAQLDALTASSGQNGIRATIEAARLEARNIHDTAQEEAARLLSEAADQTRALQRERIETSQREFDRQATLRWEVASCLETSIAALRTATERLSESDGLDLKCKSQRPASRRRPRRGR